MKLRFQPNGSLTSADEGFKVFAEHLATTRLLQLHCVARNLERSLDQTWSTVPVDTLLKETAPQADVERSNKLFQEEALRLYSMSLNYVSNPLEDTLRTGIFDEIRRDFYKKAARPASPPE